MCGNCIHALNKELEGNEVKEVYCGMYLTFFKGYSKCDNYEFDDTIIEMWLNETQNNKILLRRHKGKGFKVYKP